MIVIFASSEKSMNRVQKSCKNQGVKFLQEKHQLPTLKWVFIPDTMPKMRNFEDLQIVDLPLENIPECLNSANKKSK